MTDRRPLGTGPTRTATEAELPPAPRAPLAAERLPTAPAADPMPTRPAAGRRTLGAGPGGNPQPPTAECTAAQPPPV
ncbi:hypothetical protein JL475_31915 [Streptomyces sp. M2CJ-2]|uniref:hypothetical protein n=1 Tax=Streptomyces sp. M2CJ-2 TaxID=2803948 RepID=UPI001925E467|nr:hypothetical protein [Streptomyces sp. M2CJ-2]MBL3670502.1 hypothetical protein [Streptomyces sp. M2CJ-2]